jgi:hypothetical protein
VVNEAKINKKGIRMKKNCIGKIFIILLGGIPLVGIAHLDTHRSIARGHEIAVVQDCSQTVPAHSVSRYTPLAPYNNITFTITAPTKVCVGQIFTIDYAIDISKFTFISYWSDLIPDPAQGAHVKLIRVDHPTIGNFNADDSSRAQKGGRGTWEFPKGLPGSSVQHLKITMQATEPGLLKFATMAATNPPFYLGTEGTSVVCEPPVARPVFVKGMSDQPLEISILDFVTADSELQVTSISSTSYGKVTLNEDYTVTYAPSTGFYGNDSFNYKVVDAAGNIIDGIVFIMIDKSPTVQIIQ